MQCRPRDNVFFADFAVRCNQWIKIIQKSGRNPRKRRKHIVSEIVDIRSITGKQLCLHDSLCLLPRLCIFGIVVDHDCVFRVFGVEIIDKACKRVITQSDTAQHECCLSLRCIWHI